MALEGGQSYPSLGKMLIGHRQLDFTESTALGVGSTVRKMQKMSPVFHLDAPGLTLHRRARNNTQAWHPQAPRDRIPMLEGVA